MDAITESYDTSDTDLRAGEVEQAPASAQQQQEDADAQPGTEQAGAEQGSAEPDSAEPVSAEPVSAEPVTAESDARVDADAATDSGPAEEARAVTPAEDAVSEAEGGAEAVSALAPAEAIADDASEQPAEPAAEPADVAPPETVPSWEAGVDVSTGTSGAVAEPSGSDAPKSAAGHVNAGITGIAEDLQALQRGESAETAQDGAPAESEGERQAPRRGRGRGRGRGQQQDGAEQNGTQQNGQQSGAQQNGTQKNAQQGQQNGAQQGQQRAEAQQPKAEAQPAQQRSEPKQNGQDSQNNQPGQTNQNNQSNQSNQPAQNNQPGQNNQNNQNGQPDRQQQQQDGEGRGRGRYRDRKRRGQGTDFDEPEIHDDDVLIPIAGILDVLENYAFVRTSGYLPGGNDVYVSLGQVKKYSLRKGDAVVGSIRQIPDSEQPSRQKYNALVKVDSINGLPVADSEGRVEFEKLTPLYPQERLRLETEAGKVSTRIIDLFSPIGKGQRGLVVSPPRAGKTMVLQAIANAITKNNPEAHLMVVLVDERPEEVTEMQRTVKGEVIASTFDRAAEDHTTVAELAIERAKRLVELGYDVVVLLDSITRLGRAYNQVVPPSGRTLAGGIDAAALFPPKQFFGAERNIENGGSLTIIATALVETGSATDEAIFEEFKGTAHMELRLDRGLADKRIFPAVDVAASGTRREEMLMGPDEVKVTWTLRRALAGLDTQAALDIVLAKMTETSTNVEFLVQMQKSLPGGTASAK